MSGYNLNWSNPQPQMQNGLEWASGGYSTAVPQTSGVNVPAVGVNNVLGTGVGGAGNLGASPSFYDRMMGWTDTETGMQHNGWGGMALGVGQTLMNGYLGYQQLQMAKDSIRENRRQFDLNFGEQKRLNDRRIADQNKARAAFYS